MKHYSASRSVGRAPRQHYLLVVLCSVALLFFWVAAVPVAASGLHFAKRQASLAPPANALLPAAVEQPRTTARLERRQGNSSSTVDPSQCVAQGYPLNGFSLLGCFARGPGSSNAGNSSDAGCMADPGIVPTISSNGGTGTSGATSGTWHVCDSQAQMIYLAVDPVTQQKVNCDASTTLPNGAGTIQGCYAPQSATVPPTGGQPPAGLQCMSNGRLLNCTGEWHKILTINPILTTTVAPNKGNNTSAANNESQTGQMPRSLWGGIIAVVAVFGIGVVVVGALFTRRYMLKRRERQDRSRQLDPFTK